MPLKSAEKPPNTREERAARRAERREKQRAANVGRAAKMHAQRLASASLLNGITGGNQHKKQIKSADLHDGIHVGCSGWFYWHWRERFYPTGLPTSQWFSHYAKSFDTVELNAPFYSWPTDGTIKTWLRQAGRRRMLYSVKVCELITHVKRFSGTKQLVRDFGFVADQLGERMGCLLFQLPPSFDYSATRLRRILSQLEPQRKNVLEFRHRSWWNAHVYRELKSAGVIFCSTSSPKLPAELIATAQDVYIRFHGVRRWYRDEYSREELADWAQRIASCGAKRVWAYFNNDYNASAIRNAQQLERMLIKSRKV